MVVSSAAGLSLRVVLGLVLLSAAWATEALSVGSDVMVLTADNFDQAVKDHSFLVVEFFAPWCGHCKHLAPEWEKVRLPASWQGGDKEGLAATALKGDTSAGQAITLATVDATVERSLAEKYEVGGFPTIKIFEGNSATSPSEYEGPREADGIVSFLKKRAGPASKALTSADDIEELKKNERVIVVFGGTATETWTKLANSMRDSVFWAHSDDAKVLKALGVKPKSITMITELYEKNPVCKGDVEKLDKMKAFV